MVSCDMQYPFETLGVVSGGYCAQVLTNAFVAGDRLAALFSPGQYARFVACSDRATCDEVLRCATLDHGAEYCDSHHGQACDGDVLVQCPASPAWPSTVVDCAALGERCIVDSAGGACTTGASCDDTTPLRCAGGNLIATCETGVETLVDCGELLPGSACLADETGRFNCLFPGPPCEPSSAPHCEGNAWVGCNAGREQRFDCGVLEQTCIDGGCVPMGTACRTGGYAPDRCEGDSLEICVAGVYVATPCASIGFTHCVTSSDGGRCE